MTLFALQTSDDLLSVRFAVSPVWETQAAVQALADERGRTYHQSWLMLVRARAARLDLALLLAALPRRGYVPDFLTPPPRTARPSLRGQLAEIRATDPAQVARELERCRDTWTASHIAGCSPFCSPTPSARETCSPPGFTMPGPAWWRRIGCASVRCSTVTSRNAPGP
jgi:hypothetical protein